LKLEGIRVPRGWIRKYPSLFPERSRDTTRPESSSSRSHKLSVVQPVVLTEIVLLAQSRTALEIARSKPQVLEEWFNRDSIFVRNGATYRFDSSSPANSVNGDNSLSSGGVLFRYEYLVAMTEPVLQGITKLHHTRFVVTSGNFADQDNNSTSSDSPRSSLGELADESEINSDVDGIEINEDFLGNSIAGPLTLIQGSDGPRGDWREDLPDANTPSPNGLSNGSLSGSEEAQPALTTFSPCPLPYPAPSDLSGRKGDDPEAVVYLHPADLAKIGIFSGDWVNLPCQITQHLHLTLVSNRQ
jgi:peroxin-6